jgi:hypothetical protein
MPVNLRVDQAGKRGVVGYLVLPSGATSDDTSDAIVKVADYPVGNGVTVPVWGTTSSPKLFGVRLGTRSATANRWLPAPPELVSPDGRHYAYLHANGSLRIAADDGTEIPISNPNHLRPLAFTSSGVMLVENQPASNGIWLLDPTTQVVTVISPPAGTDDWREVATAASTPTASGGTFVFGVNSPGVLGSRQPTAVLAASMRPGGPVKTIYTAPAGSSIRLIAADRQAGLFVVVVGSSPGLVYLDPATGPMSVATPAGVSLAKIGPRHHADGYGIWFLGSTGIFNFNAATGFQKIAPGTATDVAPGGDCV